MSKNENEGVFWAGEPAWCWCGHRDEEHYIMSLPFNRPFFFCNFTKGGKRCQCSEFRPFKAIEQE